MIIIAPGILVKPGGNHCLTTTIDVEEAQWARDPVSRLLEHTTTRQYVKCYGLTSEQEEEGTVYIDKNITLVGGDSKRIRLSYKYVN